MIFMIVDFKSECKSGVMLGNYCNSYTNNDN